MRIVTKFVFAAAALCCIGLTCTPASAKTAKECNAEYAANKPAIQAAKQKKADFIKACRAGTETIPASPTAGAAPAQAPAASPAPTPTAAPAAAPKSTAPQPAAARPAPAAPVSASEAQAQAKCPGGLVVWVNTSSKVYHFKGNRIYGNTKAGTYMCEADAISAGDRAAKNEKHP